MSTCASSAKPWFACYHEAGHALVAYLEGVRITSVRASRAGRGRVKPENLDDADPLAVLRVAHAGVAAERVGLGCESARLHVDSDDGTLAYQAKLKIDGNHRKLDQEAEQYVEAMFKEREAELRALATFICDRLNHVTPWADIKAELDRISCKMDD